MKHYSNYCHFTVMLTLSNCIFCFFIVNVNYAKNRDFMNGLIYYATIVSYFFNGVLEYNI